MEDKCSTQGLEICEEVEHCVGLVAELLCILLAEASTSHEIGFVVCQDDQPFETNVLG